MRVRVLRSAFDDLAAGRQFYEGRWWVVGADNGWVRCCRLRPRALTLNMATVTCKIPDALDARLEAEAKHQHISKSRVLREALEMRLGPRPRKRPVMAWDLVKHLVGSVKGPGPSDLSSNPRHLEGLGE